MPPTATPEESLGRFLHRNRRFLNRGQPLSPQVEHASQVGQTILFTTCKSVMASRHGLSIPVGVQDGVPHHPRPSTHVSFLSLTLRKESPGTRTMNLAQSEESKSWQRWWNPDPTSLPPEQNLTSSPVERLYHMNRNFVIRPSWDPKLHGKGADNHRLHHWHPLRLLFPSSNNNNNS